MFIFLIAIVICGLILMSLKSHQDNEIQKDVNRKNEIKILESKAKLSEAETYKIALEISNEIIRVNDNFQISFLDTDSIELKSKANPEIRLEMVWRMIDYKLYITSFIRANQKINSSSTTFTDSVYFYGKSKMEIIEEIRKVFQEIQDDNSLSQFIKLQ